MTHTATSPVRSVPDVVAPALANSKGMAASWLKRETANTMSAPIIDPGRRPSSANVSANRPMYAGATSAALLSHPLTNPNVNSLDLIAIARLYDHLGRVEEAIQIYEKSLEQGLPVSFFMDTIMRFSSIHRKRGNWVDAVALWEKGAGHNSASACLELAKYYEHHERDYNKALNWAQAHLTLLQSELQQNSPDAVARIIRLQRKIDKRTIGKGGFNG